MLKPVGRAACAMIVFLLTVAHAGAQQLEHPLIFFSGEGLTTYNAATDTFDVFSIPSALQTSPGTPPLMLAQPAQVTIAITIDDSGTLTGGTAGPDLQVTGAGEILLEGEIESFTVINSDGPTDIYTLTFAVSGGTLSADYGTRAGVELTSEQSTFDGTFDADFFGDAKGTIGRIAAPADCSLTLDKTCRVIFPADADLACSGKIVALRLRYTGLGFDGISTVEIVGSSGASASYDLDLAPGAVLSGQNGFSIDATFAGERDLGSRTSIFVNGVEEEIHTSCSAPVVAGQPAPLNDPKGDPSPNWLVEAFIDRDGNDVTIPDPVFAESCEIPTPGNALCDDRPTAIQFRYTGNDCAASSNDQSDDKFDCEDFGSASGPVSIVIFNDNDIYADLSGVEAGAVIDAIAANAGNDEFDSEVEAEIRDAAGNLLQTLRLHTSCSQPLALGDAYGSLEVTSFTNEEQGTVQAGSELEFRYVVGNPGPGTATDLLITDTALNPPEVPGTPIASLAAGQEATRTASTFIDGPTDGVATLSAMVDGVSCEVMDATPVTVATPPPCVVASAGFELKDDALKWDLSNNGAGTATIESISIEWPDPFGALREIKLDGDRIFEEDVAPPGAMIDSFSGASSDRQIDAGDTETLEIKFDEKYKDAQPGDILVTVVFAEGCEISFEPGNNPFGDCDGKLRELTMIWDGMIEPVNIRAYAGDPGSDLVFASGDLFIGDEVTAGDFTAADAPNDVFWEILDSAGNLIGESKFHRSCSDDEMDGPEDCGMPQGNGKNNDAGFVNDWLLEGLKDDDSALDCSEL